MKSSNAILAALASTAAAQPHGHQHAHLHPARMQHQHEHLPEKRVLETDYVVEWVTETVLEIIDATTTEWVTQGTSTGTPTTLQTVVASTTLDAGQFFEDASTILPSTTASATTTTPVAAAMPVEETTSSSSVYVALAAPAAPTTTEPAYVAPVVVETPTPSTSETPVVVATPTYSETPVAASTPATSVSGTTFSGKITWIGDTTGAYGACGQMYETGKMYVAVNPSVLDCGTDGMGTPMTITANGKTVNAIAQDKCMGCPDDHIDVATDVYEALGYNTGDGGMHDNAGLTWVLSST